MQVLSSLKVFQHHCPSSIRKRNKMAASPSNHPRKRFGLFRSSSKKKERISQLESTIQEKDEEILHLKTQNKQINDLMNKWCEEVCGSSYYVVGENVVIGENGSIYDHSNEDMVVKMDKVLENMKEGFHTSTQKQAELALELQRTKLALASLQQEITNLASNSKEMKSKLSGIMDKIDGITVSTESDVIKHIQNGVKAFHELMKKTPVDKMKRIKFAEIPVIAKPLIRMLRYKYEFHLEKLKKILKLPQLPPLEKSFTVEDDVCRLMLTWFTINSESERIVENLKMVLEKLDREIINAEQVRILSKVLSSKTDKVEVLETGNEASQGKLLVEICKRTKDIQTAQKTNIEHMEAVQQSNIDHMNRILSEGIATIFEKLFISSPTTEDLHSSVKTHHQSYSNVDDIEEERGTLYQI